VFRHIRWADVENEKITPQFERRCIVTDAMTFANIVIRKGFVVPMHSHHNEQITYIVEGALKFLIEGKEVVVRGGEVLCIPPNVPHQAEALEDTIDIDIFNPPREDWRNRTDNYLRDGKPGTEQDRKKK